MYERNLHDELTQLLMDAGAAVNKQSIDKLIEFIARRDTLIIDKTQKDLDLVRVKLAQETDRFLPVPAP